MGLENPTHWIPIIVVLLLIFGARRLPEIGRSLGSGLREFKQSIGGEAERQQPAPQQALPPVPATPEPQQAVPPVAQPPAAQPPETQPAEAQPAAAQPSATQAEQAFAQRESAAGDRG